MSEEVEYTTPAEYRYAHSVWVKAQEGFDEATAQLTVAEEEMARASAFLLTASDTMRDATAGLTRYTVDGVGDE